MTDIPPVSPTDPTDIPVTISLPAYKAAAIYDAVTFMAKRTGADDWKDLATEVLADITAATMTDGRYEPSHEIRDFIGKVKSGEIPLADL
ncbi:hypothetical protein [Frankia tisae]|uniref:hypothetical protein n=1 Tax=Frankia tisae TaxID=2950104 RepID=UPI0021C14FA2|nr:hypothetical protein [Frankia tisae]